MLCTTDIWLVIGWLDRISDSSSTLISFFPRQLPFYEIHRIIFSFISTVTCNFFPFSESTVFRFIYCAIWIYRHLSTFFLSCFVTRESLKSFDRFLSSLSTTSLLPSLIENSALLHCVMARSLYKDKRQTLQLINPVPHMRNMLEVSMIVSI